MATETETTETSSEPWNKGKTRDEWAQWQSRYDAQQAQLNQVSAQLSRLASDKAAADAELQQYRILRQTENLPDDQRTLYLLQEQARQAEQARIAAMAEMERRRAEQDLVLGQAGRRLKAEELVRIKGLESTVPTPDGEIDTVAYLMAHRESKDVEGMTTVADRIAAKAKRRRPKRRRPDPPASLPSFSPAAARRAVQLRRAPWATPPRVAQRPQN